ncbi:hypothetical protein N302_08994, partial [Corvus brachyrhynchos]
NQVIHVAFCFCKFHFIHSLSCEPVEEGLSPEHGRKLLRDPFEELLDGSAVANEGGGHLEATGRYVTHCHLDIVRDPLHEVAAVLVLDGQHLLVNLLHGHGAAEDGGHCQVPAMPWVTGCHHVFGIEHLLGELWNGECSVLLAASRRQRSKAWHEKVKAREGDHIYCQLPEVSIELAWKTQGCGHPTHGGGDQVV